MLNIVPAPSTDSTYVAPEGFAELLALLDTWDEDRCPKCGGRLVSDSLYCAGSYRAYRICNEGDCEFMQRVVN